MASATSVASKDIRALIVGPRTAEVKEKARARTTAMRTLQEKFDDDISVG